MSENAPVRLTVDAPHAGQRFDVFLAKKLPQFSRVQLRRAINGAHAKVDGQRQKAAYHLREGEQIELQMPELAREGPEPEDVPLDVLFEDDLLIAINKPAGMVVHPAKGHWRGTLTAALAFHFKSLSTIGGPTRPGIIHRLDRDTSGVIVVAKTDAAHLALARQFEHREVQKEYWAITAGCPDRDRDVIEQPIGVHPYHREKMSIRANHSTSRDAHTFYEVAERFERYALVKAWPKTGRTHQIRVHLAHVGAPILCDPLYSGRSQITRADLTGTPAEDDQPLLARTALHARQIEITHPGTQQAVAFRAPLPGDFAAVLEALRGRC